MKEVLLSFIFALVVGSIVNGLNQSAPNSEPPGAGPVQTTPTQESQPQHDAPSTDRPSTEEPSQTGAQLVEANDSSFKSTVLQAEGPVLVEFGASWCVPCKKMAPVLEELSSEYSGRLKVVHVDVDVSRTLCDQYAQGGLPTLILFNHGQARKMIVGYTSKQELVKNIQPFVL